MTILKDLESTNGMMEGLMLENERIIKCMERDYLHGQMGDNIMVFIQMMKKKAMEE
jgi:hypothetical protein